MKNKAKRNFFFYYFVKITGIIPGLLFVRPHKIYFDKKDDLKGPLLIVCNHNTYVDPLILMTAFPFKTLVFVATKELFSSKIAKWFFENVHCIKIDKNDFSMSTLHNVRDYLEMNKVVCIFPEGSVNVEHKTLNPFKSGAVIMALQSNAGILPVYIKNRKHWYEKTEIVIGKRMFFAKNSCNMNMNDISAISDELYAQELKLKSFV